MVKIKTNGEELSSYINKKSCESTEACLDALAYELFLRVNLQEKRVLPSKAAYEETVKMAMETAVAHLDMHPALVAEVCLQSWVPMGAEKTIIAMLLSVLDVERWERRAIQYPCVLVTRWQ